MLVSDNFTPIAKYMQSFLQGTWFLHITYDCWIYRIWIANVETRDKLSFLKNKRQLKVTTNQNPLAITLASQKTYMSRKLDNQNIEQGRSNREESNPKNPRKSQYHVKALFCLDKITSTEKHQVVLEAAILNGKKTTQKLRNMKDMPLLVSSSINPTLLLICQPPKTLSSTIFHP